MRRYPPFFGITQLESLWHRVCHPDPKFEDDGSRLHWVNDNTLLSGMNLGLRETLEYLHSARPAAEQFEQWILERNGGSVDQELIDRISAATSGRLPANEAAEPGAAPEPALTPGDLAFWDENGYVVLHDSVSPENCRGAAAAIYDFLGASPFDAGSWYRKPVGHTIWVPLLRHPDVAANRHSPRIRRAFAQIWKRDDLWVNVDQCGFNPPERDGWKFPGPDLHFDISLALPLSFGTQGILYLTDTDADQGAFQCIPGFHRDLETWLKGLPAGSDPRREELSGAKPIPGKAGDLIIWHHALPHGSSPNRASRPRLVQYLNLRPSHWDFNPIWK